MARTKKADTLQQQLFKELSKEARRANAKLAQLQGYGLDRESFAGKRLYDKLYQVNGLTEKGNIRYSQKELTEPQAKAILKAVKDFNKSKTSTVKGVREVQSRLKKDLAKAGLSGTGRRLTNKEANALYQLLGDKDSELANQIKYEAFQIANEIKEKNGSEADYFKAVFSNVLDPSGINDVEIRKELSDIFNSITEKKKPVKTNISTRKPRKTTTKKPKPKTKRATPVKTDISTRKRK